MKKYLIAAGVLAVILAVVYFNIPNKQQQLIEDMVALGRVYIPALAFTSQGKLEPARKAMARLLPVWEKFNAEHQDVADHDDEWLTDMAELDQHIKAANNILAAGHDLNAAHDELEPVRTVMMEARERNQIEYFIDSLTRFHEPMEVLVLSVKGRTPETLDDATIVNMRAELETATYVWNKVLKTPLHNERFGFDDKKLKKIDMLKATETAALDKLRLALSGNDKQRIIKDGIAIKPPFSKLYMAFGTFEEVQ